jgi:hypothetical protein
MGRITSHRFLDLSHELIFLIYTPEFHPHHLFPTHEISAQHTDLDPIGGNKDHIIKETQIWEKFGRKSQKYIYIYTSNQIIIKSVIRP